MDYISFQKAKGSEKCAKKHSLYGRISELPGTLITWHETRKISHPAAVLGRDALPDETFQGAAVPRPVHVQDAAPADGPPGQSPHVGGHELLVARRVKVLRPQETVLVDLAGRPSKKMIRSLAAQG